MHEREQRQPAQHRRAVTREALDRRKQLRQPPLLAPRDQELCREVGIRVADSGVPGEAQTLAPHPLGLVESSGELGEDSPPSERGVSVQRLLQVERKLVELGVGAVSGCESRAAPSFASRRCRPARLRKRPLPCRASLSL